MKKLFKKLTTIIMSFTLLAPFTLLNVSAKESSTATSSLTTPDEFSIIDSHIQETLFEFKIVNESQLEQKIGKEKLNKLKIHLQKQTIEKAKEFERGAVNDIHRAAFKAIGCSVETHWWGERIKTHNRQMSTYVRKMAFGFSGAAGDKGFKDSFINAGIGYLIGGITGAGFAQLMGAISWADAKTWSNVSEKVENKINEGRHSLTIDINAWNMDVQVY